MTQLRGKVCQLRVFGLRLRLAHAYTRGMFTKTFTVVGLAALVSPAFCAEWMTDFEAAKTKAAAENKALLVDFTGSDWCGYCIMLRQNVLDKPDFEAYAKDKFVLVEVDVPRAKQLPEELQKQNRALVEQYRISGFPSVFVMTPKGEVVGGFVGGARALADIQEPLDTGLANMKALDEARKLSGDEKLAAYGNIYKSMKQGVQASATHLVDEIIQNDPQDKCGLRHGKDVENQMEEFSQKLENNGMPLGPDAVLALVQEFEGKVFPENKLSLIQIKLNALITKAETAEDLQKAKDTIFTDLGKVENEPNIDRIKENINQVFSQPECLLQMAKQLRDRMEQMKKAQEQQKTEEQKAPAPAPEAPKA